MAQGHHQHVQSLTRSAISATLHCLTGCAIGEILGLVVATALNMSNPASIALATALAFVFGYGLSIRPIRAAGVPWRRAVRLILASDTVSIATMEVVDDAIVLVVPGAMAAGPAGRTVLVEPGAGAGDRVCDHGAGQPGADRPRPWPRGRTRVPLTGAT